MHPKSLNCSIKPGASGRGEYHKTSGFHKGGPVVLLLRKVNSLVRSSAVWKMMIADQAFCKSTDGSFDRSILYSKDEYISKIRTECCLFHEESGPM